MDLRRHLQVFNRSLPEAKFAKLLDVVGQPDVSERFAITEGLPSDLLQRGRSLEGLQRASLEGLGPNFL